MSNNVNDLFLEEAKQWQKQEADRRLIRERLTNKVESVLPSLPTSDAEEIKHLLTLLNNAA